MFTLLVSTLTIYNFIAPNIVKDELGKAYAACSPQSSGRSSGKTQTASAPDGNPVAPVPEPSTLVLMGSGLVAAGLYRKLRARKRNENNQSKCVG